MFNFTRKYSHLLLFLALAGPLSPSLSHAAPDLPSHPRAPANVCSMSQEQIQTEAYYMNASKEYIDVFGGVLNALDMKNVHDLQTLLSNTQQARATLLPAYQSYEVVRVPSRFKKGDLMLRQATKQMFVTLNTIETGLTTNNMNLAERGYINVGRVMTRLGYAQIEIGQRMKDFGNELKGKKAPSQKRNPRKTRR